MRMLLLLWLTDGRRHKAIGPSRTGLGRNLNAISCRTGIPMIHWQRSSIQDEVNTKTCVLLIGFDMKPVLV